MTYYTATYTTPDGTMLEDDVEMVYSLAEAYQKAKAEAKEHGWKLINVKPKKYDPLPHVCVPSPHPYYLPYNDYNPH